ncbi:hypothetical protein D9M68_500390 [compost metagenome]
MVHAGGVQRTLVERAEQDRIGLARLRQLQRHGQRAQAVAAAFRAGGAAYINGLAFQLPGAQARPALRKDRRVGLGERQLDARHLHAAAPFAAVGDQQDVGLFAGGRVGQQAGNQFGADAGGIAQHHRDSWT